MFIVIYITAKDKEEADKIAQTLLEQKLIACANKVVDVQSAFWWEGKVQNEQEALLIIKTKESLFDQIVEAVKKVHSYSVPEIIAMPIVKGNKEYLDWVKESTQE